MKRVHGVVLLFASLPIFWLILNGTLAREIAVTIAGFVAAAAIALTVAGGLCFLTQCATPPAIAAALFRTTPRARSRAVPPDAGGNGPEGQMQVHRTQGKNP